RQAAEKDLAAVLLVVVPVLPGRVGHCGSGHRIESYGRLGSLAAGAASDVPGLRLLPAVSGTNRARFGADGSQNRCVNPPNKPARKGRRLLNKETPVSVI